MTASGGVENYPACCGRWRVGIPPLRGKPGLEHLSEVGPQERQPSGSGCGWAGGMLRRYYTDDRILRGMRS